MFIRRVKNPQGRVYHHVVESYRKGGKVRQRTLLSLGRAEDGNLEKLLNAIQRYKDIATINELAKEISISTTFILGPLLVLQKLFEQLGVNKALKKITDSHEKLQFDLQKVIFTLISGRFIHPSSKLKVYEHWQRSLYPEIIDGELSLQPIYRS